MIILAHEHLPFFMRGERQNQHLYFVHVTVTWNFCNRWVHLTDALCSPSEGNFIFFYMLYILGSGGRTGSPFWPYCQSQIITVITCCSSQNYSIFSLLTASGSQHLFHSRLLSHLNSYFLLSIIVPSDFQIHKDSTPTV